MKKFNIIFSVIITTCFFYPAILFAQQGSLNWVRATANAGWSAREGHTSVVFNNKMWVMGGFNGTIRYNDVWYSTNGINWSQATANAGWSARCYHTSVVFNNKMWVLGGDGGGNDVWYSTDGNSWTQATANAGWSARGVHTSVVFDNKMWVIGGYDGTNRNDVWYSTNGVNWTRATANAGWSVRYSHASVVFDNKMWVMGGFDGSNTNDVWYSTNGVNWIQVNTSAGWSGRSGHTSIVFNNKMWVIGGYGPSYRNDVWHSEGIIALVSPNGGEIWVGGSTHVIKWRAIWLTRYRILLSRNGGSTYPDTIAHNIAQTETTYNWLVPTLNLNTCRVKVQMLDSTGFIISEDACDGNFTIQTSVNVVLPNGGEFWVGGTNKIIKWRTIGTGFARYRLFLSTNGGSTFPIIIADSVPPSETTYSWIVPYINSVTCRVKVQIIDAGGQVVSEDESNGNFTIRIPTPLASSQYPMFRYNLQHTGRSSYNGSQTAELRWFYHTAQPIISSPVVAPDTTIYFVSENDTLYALRPNGARQWSYFLGQGTQSTPAIASDSTIYVGDGYGNLFCFLRDLSFPLWCYHIGGSILSSPTIGNNGVVYFGSNDSFLYAINCDSTLRWRYNIGSIVHSSPAISQDSIIYIGANDGKLYAINPNGTRRWDVAMPASLFSSPLIGHDGTIYIGCCNGKLYAVDRLGVVKWSFTTGDSITSSPAINTQGRIFFGSYDRYVYAVEDSGYYAKLKWRYQTGDKVRSSPSISVQGTVYIGSDDGDIYAFRGSDSTVIWTRTTGNAVQSSPAIGANGTIYIGSNDGRLYAIGQAVSVAESKANSIPSSCILYEVHPNPFNKQITIRYSISSTGKVTLIIYDISGRLVKTLANENMKPGFYTINWNGMTDKGTKAMVGIYFCRLETDKSILTQKLTLLR